ncbi:PH domain-containing protein [Propionibacteriaceae bacterium Y2011]|uniref:PH domain-containing protein n=1 Tax=Microlunatus sp. Y2014 TaxID=3418488 RepID=UPI003B46D23F
MDTLFAPPDQEWHRISPRYRTLEVVRNVVGAVVVSTIPALILGLGFQLWWISAICWGVGAALLVLSLVLVPRQWRAWGYALREDDLYVTHGVMFRTLTAVPYGRMQVVEVTSGPLERAFKLATISFVTASADTDASIPGLPPEEAARLRDHLTELGESRATGL